MDAQSPVKNAGANRRKKKRYGLNSTNDHSTRNLSFPPHALHESLQCRFRRRRSRSYRESPDPSLQPTRKRPMISITNSNTASTDCGDGIYLTTFTASNIVSIHSIEIVRLVTTKPKKVWTRAPQQISFKNSFTPPIPARRKIPCHKTAARSQRRFFVNKLRSLR